MMLKERLLRRIEPIPESGCWLWTGAGRKRYGSIKVQGKMVSTHRLSYELFIEPIPPDLYVLHKCDVMCCINPNHLFLGSGKDNELDKVAKGRQVKGVRHWAAKLTPKQVIEIRNDSRTQTEIAASFNIDQCSVSEIKRRITWKHI